MEYLWSVRCWLGCINHEQCMFVRVSLQSYECTRAPGSNQSFSYCLRGVLHVLPVSAWGFLQVIRFPSTSKKEASRWVFYGKLPLGVNECIPEMDSISTVPG